MADEGLLQGPPMLPYDSDGQLIELLWSRLSGAVWHHMARRAFQDDNAAASTELPTVRLSLAELRMLLAILRNRARLNQPLIAKFEAALEGAG